MLRGKCAGKIKRGRHLDLASHGTGPEFGGGSLAAKAAGHRRAVSERRIHKVER
jgi:hypothetical protein